MRKTLPGVLFNQMSDRRAEHSSSHSLRRVLMALCFLTLLGFGAQVWAAISTVDAPSPNPAATGTTTAISASATVSSGANVLVVLLATRSGSTAYSDPATLSWNGQTITRIVTQTNSVSTFRSVSIYTLNNPPTGTANVTGTGPAGTTFWALKSFTLAGVDTVIAPLTGSVGASGNTTSLSFPIAGCPAGGFAAVCANWSTVTTPISFSASSGVTNTTSEYFSTASGNDIGMGYVSGLNAGANTFNATVATANKSTFAAAVFTPAAVCEPPLGVFSVTGGGNYNPGGGGVAVGLSGSETGAQYQLRVNGVNQDSPVPGTGATLSFGLQTSLGNYTVSATNALTGCSALMSGSVTVGLNTVAIPAFPGAEGFGKYSKGGRGGDVYVVTNLNDSGPGSFRNGLANVTGPRTIVFEVSGIIDFTSSLSVSGLTNITVAGQTAPGKGITFKSNDRGFAVNWCRDFIWRYVKFRSGPDLTGVGGNDCLTTEDGPAGASQFVNNWILDHCSLSWGVDGNMDLRSIMNYTVQWCLFYEALNDSTHYKLEPHGMCTSQRGLLGNAANHHNLYGSSRDRHPSFGGDGSVTNAILDYRNCVVYNWGLEKNNHLSNTNIGGDSDGWTRFFGVNYNVISNYYRRGPELGSSVPLSPRQDTNGSVQMVYFGGNKFTGYPTENDSWAAARNSDVRNALHYGYYDGGALDFTNNHMLTQPHDLGEFTPQTHTADQAYELILLKGGASKKRDNADSAFVTRVRSKTGFVPDTIAQSAAGAWDTASESRPANWDTDRDGIPNYWEEAVGMNPNVANNNHVNPDGYTDLEHYLNWLAEPCAVGGKNLPVDVNMRTLYGDTNALNFAVANPTNGMVALLAGGNVARFTPAANHVGLASFQFIATNSATGVGFGPLSVGLVITNSAALPPTNPPPTLAVAGFTNGQISLLIGGDAGQSYTMQASTNLVNWSNLLTTNPPVLPFIWTDTAASNFSRRFYRVINP